jgi:hypothetical protein
VGLSVAGALALAHGGNHHHNHHHNHHQRGGARRAPTKPAECAQVTYLC